MPDATLSASDGAPHLLSYHQCESLIILCPFLWFTRSEVTTQVLSRRIKPPQEPLFSSSPRDRKRIKGDTHGTWSSEVRRHPKPIGPINTAGSTGSVDSSTVGWQDTAAGYDTGSQGVAGIFTGPLPVKTAVTQASDESWARQQGGMMVTHTDSGERSVWIQFPPPLLARVVWPWAI